MTTTSHASANRDDEEQAILEWMQREAFADLHPTWQAWRSTRSPRDWHAYETGSLPIVLIHADGPEELSEKVTEFKSLIEIAAQPDVLPRRRTSE